MRGVMNLEMIDRIIGKPNEGLKLRSDTVNFMITTDKVLPDIHLIRASVIVILALNRVCSTVIQIWYPYLTKSKFQQGRRFESRPMHLDCSRHFHDF